MKSFGDKEFIKVYRKIIHWQWYSDTPARSLFLHCLLMANWSSGNWKNIHYERGEFITSLQSLSNELGLSVQEIRTAIKRLKSTGELTDRSTNKYRIITVLNYDGYQVANSQANIQLTDKQQAANKQLTTDKEYKEIKKNKEEKKKDIYIAFFEDMWKMYPRKLGKGSVSQKSKKELFDAGKDVVETAIKNYRKEIDGRDEKFIMYGSTFFNGRWKDYMAKPSPTEKQKFATQEPEEFKRFKNLPPEVFEEFRKLGIISDEGGVCCGDATEKQIRILQEAGAL